MSAAPNSSADKIHPLTSLRFFAAFFVVVYHTLGNLVRGRLTTGNKSNFLVDVLGTNFMSGSAVLYGGYGATTT